MFRKPIAWPKVVPDRHPEPATQSKCERRARARARGMAHAL